MKKICEQCGQKDCGFVNRGKEDGCDKVQWYQQGYDDAFEKVCEYIKTYYDEIYIRYLRGYESEDLIESIDEFINNKQVE